MTYEAARAVRRACDAAGVTGIVMHAEQFSDTSHYVELPVIPPWTVAAWQASDAAAMVRTTAAA